MTDKRRAREEESEATTRAWIEWSNKQAVNFITSPSVSELPDTEAVHGGCVFMHDGWDDDVKGRYYSRVYHSPSWGEVFKEFNTAVRHTDSLNRIWAVMMGVTPTRMLRDGVKVYRFIGYLENHE